MINVSRIVDQLLVSKGSGLVMLPGSVVIIGAVFGNHMLLMVLA